jgi:hypothetical protein
MGRLQRTGVERGLDREESRLALAEVTRAMDQAAEREAYEATAPTKARDEALSALAAPFERLIKQDPSARQAFEKLRGELLPELSELQTEDRPIGGKALTISLTVHKHLDFQFPPYDGEWAWGTIQPLTSKSTGFYSAYGRAGSVQGGPYPSANGAAGLACVLISPTDTTVQLRPLVEYEYTWQMAANLGSANGSGGLDLSA